ncbi:MAG: LapA family protein [Anaerolineae bacterium]|nr:LapA family protein [Phycisphaerae bacterium]
MWLKIKVWTKITLASLLALYILIFVLKNTTPDVTFWWWFNRTSKSSVFTLALLAFLSGAVAMILVRTTWSTYTQIRELQRRSRSHRLERDLADMKSKAAMLKTRDTTSASATVITNDSTTDEHG